MSREDDYRRNAAETVELAKRATTTQDRGRLLALAEKWLDLADRVHRVAKVPMQKLREHPLLKAKLGGERPDAE